MSYADVTAKNSEQSLEDARAPQLPEIENTTSTSSLVDVDSPHVTSVPSDFDEQSVKTDTQAQRIERELEHEAKVLNAKGKSAASKAKAKGKSAGKHISENRDNPVVIGNALLAIALTGGFGYMAYARHRAGELSWKVVGLGAAVLAGFGIADYYASQFFFKKYPPKK